tara:strand:+ start:613 stop:870 length:258 start_codon:yes stop_codon:yes gene_type:complete
MSIIRDTVSLVALTAMCTCAHWTVQFTGASAGYLVRQAFTDEAATTAKAEMDIERARACPSLAARFYFTGIEAAANAYLQEHPSE